MGMGMGAGVGLGMYDDEARDAAMELADGAAYEEMEVRTAYRGAERDRDVKGGIVSNGNGGAGDGDSGGSADDGTGSPSGAEDSFGVGGMMGTMGGGAMMNILGKPLATNNFVTKLYQ